jgi:N-acetylglucosamine kinase-like BadF-type ATPase
MVEGAMGGERVLAVDGGNSKTLAIVAEPDGHVRGVGRAGGSNHQSSPGLTGALRQITLSAERALAYARLSSSDLAGAYFCLAGADLPEDFAMLEPALQDLDLAPRLGLNNDSIAILRSATDNPNAVAVGWGTGTNGVGRNAEGEEIRLPALGWISGDWGGGGDLAQEAVRVVARAHDGRGPATVLTDLVTRALGTSGPEEMIRMLYFRERQAEERRQRGEEEDDDGPRVLDVAPLVFRAAGAGDSVADELVARAAEEVAVTAVALLRRLGLMVRHADVVLGGSIFKGDGAILVHAVAKRLRVDAPNARVVVPTTEPVVGALFCAMDMLGVAVTPRVRTLAKESYRGRAGRAREAGVR